MSYDENKNNNVFIYFINSSGIVGFAFIKTGKTK